jgi:hypothetical protein
MRPAGVASWAMIPEATACIPAWKSDTLTVSVPSGSW